MPKITAVAVPGIDRSIHALRGHRVLLDQDLARLYGVETKRLNEVVKRNNRNRSVSVLCTPSIPCVRWPHDRTDSQLFFNSTLPASC